MTRVSVIVLLACAGVVPVTAKAPFDSIRPLQYRHEGAIVPLCTAWATRITGRLVWVSALHCVQAAGPDRTWLIDGKPAVLEGWDADHDLVRFQGGPSARGLVVAVGVPSVRTPLWATGYPYGSKAQHTTAGILSAMKDDDGMAVFTVAVAAGMSGAAVYDKDQLVVGMLQEHECEAGSKTFCPVSRGAFVPALRTFLVEGSADPMLTMPPAPRDPRSYFGSYLAWLRSRD